MVGEGGWELQKGTASMLLTHSKRGHKECAIFLEMKFAYFSRILAFLRNKRLSIPKVNFGNAEFDSDWQLAL